MKYLKIGIVIFGICAFLNMSISGYYRNYVHFYNIDFSSLVIWVYFPLAFFSTLRAWLTFSIIELADKMEISKAGKNKYIVLVAVVPTMISLYIEDFRNYDAILHNGWNGLLFYPSFLSNLFLVIYYLVLKNKPNQSVDDLSSADSRNSSTIFP